jgi:transposase InsO family protein
MHLKLHKNARTTPAIRAELHASTDTHEALAKRYGLSISTVRKWRKRDEVHDRSHTAHRLQTTLTPEQEGLAVELRKTLRLSLDDLLVVVREFLNPAVSRSGLDRCLRRHGIGNLSDLEPVVPTPAPKTFKSYEPGFIHMDVKYLPQMPDETSRRYLFVAIDRATRWVHVAIKPRKTAAAAQSFLKSLHKAAPFKIHKLLTDNGSEFTDRLFNKSRAPSGEHEFDQLCASLGIEHRLTKPRTPQTNGMVERFNGRISEVLATNRFISGEDLSETIERYVWLYNHHLPQLGLQHRTPVQALKDWQKSNPELFIKTVYNRPGCDSYSCQYTP